MPELAPPFSHISTTGQMDSQMIGIRQGEGLHDIRPPVLQPPALHNITGHNQSPRNSNESDVMPPLHSPFKMAPTTPLDGDEE